MTSPSPLLHAGEERRWLAYQERLLRSRPSRKHQPDSHKQPIRALLWWVAESRWFSNFILACIVANTLTLTLSEDMPATDGGG